MWIFGNETSSGIDDPMWCGIARFTRRTVALFRISLCSLDRPVSTSQGTACLVELVKRGGPNVMFRGSLPRMIEISLGGVLYFSAMAATKKALGWVDEEDEEPDEKKGE